MKQSRFSAMIKMTILSFLSLALLSFLAVFSQISLPLQMRWQMKLLSRQPYANTGRKVRRIG